LYYWGPADWQLRRYDFSTRRDKLLVSLSSDEKKASISGLKNARAEVEFDSLVGGMATLSLLALLGWYIMLLHKQDAKACVAMMWVMP
jgi:hypothetical protein